jgi:hypothetical protein
MATKLPYVVECKSTYPFFEPIAAFKVAEVAVAYAKVCKETNPMFRYRVCKGKKILALSIDSNWIELDHTA